MRAVFIYFAFMMTASSLVIGSAYAQNADNKPVQAGTGVKLKAGNTELEVQDPAQGEFDWPAGYALFPNAKMDFGALGEKKSPGYIAAYAIFITAETQENVFAFYQNAANTQGHKTYLQKNEGGTGFMILLPTGYLYIGGPQDIKNSGHFVAMHVRQ